MSWNQTASYCNVNEPYTKRLIVTVLLSILGIVGVSFNAMTAIVLARHTKTTLKHSFYKLAPGVAVADMINVATQTIGYGSWCVLFGVQGFMEHLADMLNTYSYWTS